MGLSSKWISIRDVVMLTGTCSAMMSAISEAWTIMNKHLDMKYDEIGKVFEKWSLEGELVSRISRS